MAVTLDLDFTTGTLDPRITFSRASLGTYFDSAGVLKYAAHNFALQSQDFNTTWTKQSSATVTVDATAAPDSTTTADQLNHTVGGTVVGGGVSQTLVAPAYRTILSVYAKAGTKSWLSLGIVTSTLASYAFFNLSAGTVGTTGASLVSAGITSIGSGWYQCWIVSTTAAAMWIRVGEADNTLNCTSTGNIYIWGAQAEYVTTATTPSTYLPTTTVAVHAPRFDYDPVTHVAKGLLIEEARTNLSLLSQDITGVNWTRTGCTSTLNQIAAPDGTVTADLITATATTATVDQTTSAVGNYVASIFIKKGTSDWVYMVGENATSPKAWFNIGTGVVGTIQAGLLGAQIQDVGSGWYRCAIADAAGAGAEPTTVGLCDADNSATVTVGRTIYLWGAQNEVGALPPSSYIPSVAGSVARAADIAVMTGSNFSSWYNASAGTFVAKFELLAASGTRPILTADNNATAEQILLYGSGSDPKAKVRDNSVDQADLDLGTIAA